MFSLRRLLVNQVPAPKLRVTNRPTLVSPVKKNILCGGVPHSEEKHPQRAKIVADNNLCFSCFNQNHTFRKCLQPRKCTKDECGSSHNTFLHGAKRIFAKKVTSVNKDKTESSGCIGTSMNNERSDESSGMPSVADVKGLLQVTEVELNSNGKSQKVLALCDSACSHSLISANLATKLNVHGTPTKLTVHGINSNQVVDTQLVELKLTPVHSGGSCSPFVVKPYVKEDLKVGTDTIDVELLKTKYRHLQPISLKKYSYADVEMILGQDVFHSIRPLEYFDSDRKNVLVAVRLPLGWVLSRPLLSSLGLYSTCFKAVASNKKMDSALANQLRSWYEIESYGAYKQVDSRSAAGARALEILEETTYHDGNRYHMGMLWTEADSSLPNNYFSSLVQLKSLERRLDKDHELKKLYVKTIHDDFNKSNITKVEKTTVSNWTNPASGFCHTIP